MTPTPESRLAHDLGIPEQDLRFEALRNARNDALVAADRCLLAGELLKYDLYMDVYATCQADMQAIGQARAKAKRDAQYASGKWPELPITSIRACGRTRPAAWAWLAGITASSAPQITQVGMVAAR